MSDLIRPIVGIENRTAQEVFDIMVDRFKRKDSPSSHLGGPEEISMIVVRTPEELAAALDIPVSALTTPPPSRSLPIVKAVCQHCERMMVVPKAVLEEALKDSPPSQVVDIHDPSCAILKGYRCNCHEPKLNRERAATAAVEANNAYGQWMPELWLHLFLDAYERLLK